MKRGFSGGRTRAVLRVCLLLCIAMVLQLVLPVSASAQEYPTVRVGYYQADGFQQGDGVTRMRSGYGYEYLQKVASYTGWRYEYVPGTWDELYEKLKTGEIDLMAGVSWSEERSREILFPDLEMLKETFYIYKDIDDSSMQSGILSSYAGKRIGVTDDAKMRRAIEEWKSTTGAGIEIVYFSGLQQCADAFNSRQIDGFVSADNIVSGYTGISPVDVIGRVPYYLCAAKQDTELMSELNTALSLINGQDSVYLSGLRNKYSADTSISIFLTRQEQDWMNEHPTIRVGFLNDYMPYSDKAADGSARGLLTDTLSDIFSSLPGGYEPEITYISYEGQQDMIDALRNNDVDLVFPVGGELPYAEQNGYQQSSVTIQAAIDLVYTGDYDAEKLSKIAVNRHNVLQCEYTRTHYPDAEILEYDSIEDCIRAIKRGEAGCTLVEALRAVRMLGEDKALEMLPLTDTCDFCFGVNYGDTGLLRVLNHGLSILGEDYGISHVYQYVGDITTYNMRNFVRSHMWLVYVLAAVLLIWLLCIFAVRYRMLKKISASEAKHNHALQQALMKAQQANYARQLFLNNLSHDIRTPLNVILGLGEINQKTADPEVIRRNQAKVKDAEEHLLAMLNNMIEMNQLESGDLPDLHEPVDRAAVSAAIENRIRQQTDKKGLTFVHESHGTPEVFPLVQGSAVGLQEIFQHILENAVKYTRSGGRIEWHEEWRMASDGRLLYRATISDTGIGMKPEFLRHIYEPFAQERCDARTSYTGTGLGMAIVHSLIEGMHGTIDIESQENKGTRVVITLPFTVCREQPDTAAVPSPVTLRGRKILVVEDNELNVEIVRFMLEEAGASVTVARDGAQAVEAYLNAPEGSFDAVLMDIMMPVMNGLDATRKIRASGRRDAKTLPVIATTACVTEEARAESIAAGLNGFVEKPLDIEKLTAALSRVLRP